MLKKFDKFVNEKLNSELDPYGEERDDDAILIKRDKIIADIKFNVEKYGKCLTMMDLQADYSPVQDKDEDAGEIHLIEKLYVDYVEVIVYGGYKMDSEIYEYNSPYEIVSIENLEYIKELIDIMRLKKNY